MRVIGGSARGRRIRAPSGLTTRPTKDRARQTLFDVLGQRCDGLRVLDLFAGSGALGIEALSRGADECVFVEQDRRALDFLRGNLRELGFCDRAKVRKGDALKVDVYSSEGPFDLVLMDPPYFLESLIPLELVALHSSRLLSEEARIVIEHFRREEPLARIGPLTAVDRRRFGETMLTFYSYDEKRP